MPDYTLNIRRFHPDSGLPAYWQEYGVDLPEERSVLDAILRAKDEQDGSLSIRCSCQAAICGSCGVPINRMSRPACNTKPSAGAEGGRNGAIAVQPMGHISGIKDLIRDMDAVHWQKG